MPTTNNRTQTLATVGSNVMIRVTYNAVFSPLERHLAANGLIFRERIQVIGEDPGTATDLLLHNFPLENIPVPAGVVPPIVSRNRSITVPRASLQEDPGLGDADEIRCSIEITPIGLPTVITNFTPEGTLLG
jgi:hypothetical protein